jgi:hypothetical protein
MITKPNPNCTGLGYAKGVRDAICNIWFRLKQLQEQKRQAGE